MPRKFYAHVERIPLRPDQVAAYYGLPEVSASSSLLCASDDDAKEKENIEMGPTEGRKGCAGDGTCSFTVDSREAAVFDDSIPMNATMHRSMTSKSSRRSVLPVKSASTSFVVNESVAAVFDETIPMNATLGRSMVASKSLRSSRFAPDETAAGAFNDSIPENGTVDSVELDDTLTVQSSPSTKANVSSSFHVNSQQVAAFDETIPINATMGRSVLASKSLRSSSSGSTSFAPNEAVAAAFNESVPENGTLDSVQVEEMQSAADVSSSFHVNSQQAAAFNETIPANVTLGRSVVVSKSQRSCKSGHTSFAPDESAAAAFNNSIPANGTVDSVLTERTPLASDVSSSFQVNSQQAAVFNETVPTNSTVRKSLTDESCRTLMPSSDSVSASRVADELAAVAIDETISSLGSTVQESMASSIGLSISAPPSAVVPRVVDGTSRVSMFRPKPRFMCDTAASISRQKDVISSPKCEREVRTEPKALTPLKPATPTPPRATVRKSFFTVPNITTQTTNCCKGPVLNLEEFEGLPRFQRGSDASPPSSPNTPVRPRKRVHITTPVVDRSHKSQPSQSSTQISTVSTGSRVSRKSALAQLQSYGSPSPARVASKSARTDSASDTSRDISIVPAVTSQGSSATECSRRQQLPTQSPPLRSLSELTLNEQKETQSLNAADWPDNDDDTASSSMIRNNDFNDSMFDVNVDSPEVNKSCFPISINKMPPPKFNLDDEDEENEEVVAVDRTNLDHTIDLNVTADSTRRAPIRITASKKKQEQVYVLSKPKLVKPENLPTDTCRRSQRTRVRKLQSYYGERPVYEFDEQGFRTLVGVTTVEVRSPRAVKYRSIDPRVQMAREKEAKSRTKHRKEFAMQAKAEYKAAREL